MKTLSQVLKNVKKVVRVDFLGPCWEWQLPVGTNGRGHISFRGAVVLVHRLLYGLLCESLPPGVVVMHICDNRLCCNPGHLMTGTAKDNAEDASRKGRMRHKLTPAHIEDAVEAYQNGETIRSIAARAGVSAKTLSLALHGRTHAASGGVAVERRPHEVSCRHRRKLTDDDVRSIASLSSGGHAGKDIAERFGVSEAMVSRILSGSRRQNALAKYTP